MNKTLTTTLTVLAILALAAVIFFAGSMYALVNAFGPSMMGGYAWNGDNAYGPNMMGGYDGMMNGRGSNMTLAPGASAGVGGYGYNNADLTPLTIDQAKAAAEKYLANLDNSDLEIAEIMIFDNHAYVIVQATSTSIGAFELLVDPVS